MANKDLFKQAIAEAKSVREAAIANAKEALEETLTPHLKDMLAAKLQEMEDKSTDEEVVNEIEEEEVEEAKHHDKDKDMDEAHKDKDMDEAHKDDDMDEAPKPKKEEAVEEDLSEVDPVGEAEEDEAEDDSEESDDEAEDEIEDVEGEEDAEGDEEIGDLTVDQFKDLIRDVIAQEMGAGADDELPADDMDGGDIEGMGDEPELDVPGDEPADEEEIDLDELLRELEAVSEAEDHDDMDEAHKDKKDEAMHGKKKDKAMDEDTSNQVSAEAESKEDKPKNVNRTVKEETNKELKQALETIEQLKVDLHETNLLNSKLLYVNKIFKANNLNESQKVNVIAAFDKAETVKEVKLVFETVSENVVTKKATKVNESKLGMASKPTGTTAAKPEVITEVSDAVKRMQKLAGII